MKVDSVVSFSGDCIAYLGGHKFFLKIAESKENLCQ